MKIKELAEKKELINSCIDILKEKFIFEIFLKNPDLKEKDKLELFYSFFIPSFFSINGFFTKNGYIVKKYFFSFNLDYNMKDFKNDFDNFLKQEEVYLFILEATNMISDYNGK